MGVMPLVTAALAPLLTALNVIPISIRSGSLWQLWPGCGLSSIGMACFTCAEPSRSAVLSTAIDGSLIWFRWR
jgi:hypothetical protein